MDNQYDRATNWDWQVIEVERFIFQADKDKKITPTIQEHYWNFFVHLETLFANDQILIQRNEDGKLIGICGWIKYFKEDEHKINKVSWRFPRDISTGEHLYITICVMTEGLIGQFKEDLKIKVGQEVKSIFWFNIQSNKFFRRNLGGRNG